MRKRAELEVQERAQELAVLGLEGQELAAQAPEVGGQAPGARPGGLGGLVEEAGEAAQLAQALALPQAPQPVGCRRALFIPAAMRPRPRGATADDRSSASFTSRYELYQPP